MVFELVFCGVRVNFVFFGFVEIFLMQFGFENECFIKVIEKNMVLKCVGKSDEIVNVIVFVVFKEVFYMIGSDLLVDGGWFIV